MSLGGCWVSVTESQWASVTEGKWRLVLVWNILYFYQSEANSRRGIRIISTWRLRPAALTHAVWSDLWVRLAS